MPKEEYTTFFHFSHKILRIYDKKNKIQIQTINKNI